MADGGGLKLEIDEALAERLRVAAEASGESVETFALHALRAAADDDWAEDYARFAEYERTGEYIDAETAMRDFKAALKARFAEKRK